MKFSFRRLVFFITLFSSFANAELNEQQLRHEIKMATINAFYKQDFNFLESKVEAYRNNQERTLSGVWKLTIFYGAFGEVGGYKDEESWRYLYSVSDKWIQQYPNSPTPYIVKSLILSNHAWKYRGNDYVKDVKDEDWKPFRSKISKGIELLLSVKEIGSSDPHWYTALADLASGSRTAKIKSDEILKEGIQKHPYYYQLYFAVAKHKEPKWGGSWIEHEKFIKEAIGNTGDLEESSMFARIYWTVISSYGHQKARILIYDSIINWDSMANGMEDVIKRYPDNWNLNHFAIFSCVAFDPFLTKKYIDMLKNKPDLKIWGSQKHYNRCENLSIQLVQKYRSSPESCPSELKHFRRMCNRNLKTTE